MMSVSIHLVDSKKPVEFKINTGNQRDGVQYGYLTVSNDNNDVTLFMDLDQIQALKRELTKLSMKLKHEQLQKTTI